MSSNNNSYFSRAFPSDNVTFDGNVYRMDATPKYALGFRAGRADGAVFRYSQFGATTVSAARLVATTNTNFRAESDNALVVGSAAVAVVGSAELPGNIGSRFVQVKSDGVVANQYAGGYLIIESGTGSSAAGTYLIKGNTASTTISAVGNFTLELYDRLQVTLDATTDIAIISSPYSDLDVYTRVTKTTAIGVTVSNPVTATPFAFIQTWGVSNCLTGAATPAIGQMVVPSALVAGAVDSYMGSSVGTVSGTDLTMGPILGFYIQAATASRQAPIFLTMAR